METFNNITAINERISAINDAYRYYIPLYLADKVRSIVQNIEL